MSFLSPFFLLGLAALGIPILVHLVRKTRAKRVEFPSLMFVRRIPQRTIRRKRLHNRLLLLMRTLAILLLILAFTRPYFSGKIAKAGSGNKASVVLLDTSFSMRYGKRFDQAKSEAAKVISGGSPGDRVALVNFSQTYQVISRLTGDSPKVRALLDTVQVGYGATEYGQALRGAVEMLKEEAIGQRIIYLISDFHSSGWTTANDQFRLNKDIKLIPIDVSEPTASNLAVGDVNAQPQVYQQKYPDKLTARIYNYSDEPRKGVKVDFTINDHPVEKRELSIGAHDSQLVEFTDFNLASGANRCVIEVGGDDFQLDNRNYFVIHRQEQAKALVIETASRGRSESFYLRNAITTGENLPYSLTIKTAGSVSPAELSEYKVIILNDVSGLQSAVAAQLGHFVEQGGGLIIGTGPHVTSDEFNNAFKTISPALLRDVVQPRGDYVVMSAIKTDHPIFELFREAGTLSSAHVSGYFHSEPQEKSSVLANFEDGTPALIESSYGRGKVLLFTSTFDIGWNDLPLTPFYLPLVRQMMRYLGETEANAEYSIEQPFAVRAGKDGQPPAVDLPTGSRLTTHTMSASDELIVTPTEPGFYHLRYADNPDFVAVDLSGPESDLSKLDVTQFVAAVTGTNVDDVRNKGVNPGEDPGEIESGQRVWWLLLIIAALLFVAEALLAQRTKVARVIG